MQLGSSLMNIARIVTENSKMEAKKRRSILISMSLIEAGAAAVTGIYTAWKDSKSVYEGIIKTVAVLAEIAATTGTYIASMKSQSFAGGTRYAPGGLSLVGEEGPELRDVPTGSRIFTARETKRAMESNQSVNISLNVNGPVTREALPGIRNELNNFSRTLERAVRRGAIKWNQLGVATI
jgi:hypothetical protein